MSMFASIPRTGTAEATSAFSSSLFVVFIPSSTLIVGVLLFPRTKLAVLPVQPLPPTAAATASAASKSLSSGTGRDNASAVITTGISDAVPVLVVPVVVVVVVVPLLTVVLAVVVFTHDACVLHRKGAVPSTPKGHSISTTDNAQLPIFVGVVTLGVKKPKNFLIKPPWVTHNILNGSGSLRLLLLLLFVSSSSSSRENISSSLVPNRCLISRPSTPINSS
mmetsp:Transcript_3080/g.4796  ORF Transcript_3080/g.4796 Transcript_3080/m.4796 type:complete len:221 (+) Transcript_3080:1275-1937(+)